MEREELKKLIRENVAQQRECQRAITAAFVADAETKPDKWSQEMVSKSKLELLRYELAALLDGDGNRAFVEIEERTLSIADRESAIAHRSKLESMFERQANATERWATALERIATALEKAAEAT